MSQGLEKIEEDIAYLTRLVDDLSDVVARQDRDLQRLTAQVAQLRTREAEREAQDTSALPIADRPPPHY